MAKNKKHKELWHRLVIKEGFEDDIRQIRKEAGIIENGFRDDNKSFFEWDSRVQKLNKEKGIAKNSIMIKIVSGTNMLIDKYGLKGGHEWFYKSVIQNYIINGREPWRRFGHFGVSLEQNSKEDTAIYFKPGVAKSDAHRFIDENWDLIELLTRYKHNNKTPKKRIRERKNRDRDELVFKLYSLPRERLGLKGEVRGEYKDIRVADLLKEHGVADITPENVRQIVKRERDRRKSA